MRQLNRTDRASTLLSLGLLGTFRGGWAVRRRLLVGVSAVGEPPTPHDASRHPKLVLRMNSQLADHVIDLDRSKRYMLADNKIHRACFINRFGLTSGTYT